MPSTLETALLQAPARNRQGEIHELCVLRDVLTQRIGTAAQRNTLLRIIKAHAPRGRLVTNRLISAFGGHDDSYLNIENQGVSSFYSTQTVAREDEDEDEDGPQT